MMRVQSNGIDRCCYVLTTYDNRDLAIMTHVSMLSLRRVHPMAKITVVMDVQTERYVRVEYGQLLDDADEVVSIYTGESSAAWSSRSLKTSLRSILRGEYLFVDFDIVVLASLDEFRDSGATMVATALRMSREKIFGGGEYGRKMFEKFDQMGWPRPVIERPYVSSGIYWIADNVQARELGEQWHELWRASREVMGGIDMPALYRAMEIVDPLLKLLPDDRFNYVTVLGPRAPTSPAVLHFGGWPALRDKHLLLNYLIEFMKRHGKLDESAIDRARQCNDAWVGSGPGVRDNWRTGRYGAAVRNGFARMWRGVTGAAAASARRGEDG